MCALYRRGKVWWYSFEFEGRRVQESSGHTNKTAAMRAEAKRKADLLERRAGFKRKKLAPKFDEFAGVFLAWSKQQHRPKTHALHALNCETLKRFFRSQWLDDITPGAVEDFKLARIGESRRNGTKAQRKKGNAPPVSGATVNRELSTLRLLFNHADRCGYQVTNPTRGLEFFDEGTGRMRILSFEEELAYFREASQPLRDIARIILDTGMRPEEVFRIEVSNVDLERKTIFNPFGKTPAARRLLSMSEEVFRILKARVASAKGSYVFPSPENPERPIGSVRKAHDAAVRRASIADRFRLYDLRHTFASRAAMAGVDLATLAAILGHTKIQMSLRYTHPSEEHKRGAVEKLEKFNVAEALKAAKKSQRVSTISATLPVVN